MDDNLIFSFFFLDSDVLNDDEYARVFGKMKAVPSHNQTLFVGEWE